MNCWGQAWKPEDQLGEDQWGRNGSGLDMGDASRVSDTFWEQSRGLAYHNMGMSGLNE